jgi:metal-responsive CopG/Arc/MetJ family transcriptional regulator
LTQEVQLRTVKITLDEDLLKTVDEAVKHLRTTRSAFTRDALRGALKGLAVTRLEQQHRSGYEANPVKKGDFSVWEREQHWGDD